MEQFSFDLTFAKTAHMRPYTPQDLTYVHSTFQNIAYSQTVLLYVLASYLTPVMWFDRGFTISIH